MNEDLSLNVESVVDTDQTVAFPESQDIPDSAEDSGQAPLESDDQPIRINFADDPELVKKAQAAVASQYLHNRSNRMPFDIIWRVASSMYSCGQNASLVESERQRHDRQAYADSNGVVDETGRDTTLTKAYKKGSTLFFRQVRTLAAQILSVLQSKPDPYKYTPILGCDSFVSDKQAYDLADQHNILARWARKKDNFDVKVTDLIFKLIKYGNVPICVGWNRNQSMRTVRVPIYGAPDAESGEPKIVGYKFETKPRVVNNEPSLGVIANENFWADSAVGEIQKQSCIVVDDYVPLSEIQQDEVANGFYLNTGKITMADQWGGQRDDYQVQEHQAVSDGLVTYPNRQDTGLFKKSDAYVMLPIDESGKWVENGPMRKFWLTFVGNSIDSATCVRFERNPDPDDEWPFEMLHCLPDDSGKLYHFGYAQALRGDYDEQTTTRQQLIDNRTLQNNKPLKVIQGECYNNDLRFRKDKVFQVEKENSVTEFQVMDIQQNGLAHLAYFDEDANRAAGTDKPLMGEYAGARTSASEASIVSQNASNPHIMLAKYVLHTLLNFHARKSLALWQLYGDNDQILSLTNKNQQRKINPSELFGEYDVEIDLVDEFEQNALNVQTMTQAIQTLTPVFASVMDLNQVGQDIFGKIVKGIDVSKWFKPSGNKDAILLAQSENRGMIDSGMVLSPNAGEDHDTHLGEHSQERARWHGAEDQNPNIQILDRHIAMTKMLKEQESQLAGQMSQMPNAMTANQTVGQATGNAIAGQMGAMQ
jgi:hypothetical protein